MAQLAVRLTEMTPGGNSWLVAYVLSNLTHRDSHEQPRALEPGRFYDAELTMAFVAHRFVKGVRIRIAMSAGLWPLAWPSPDVPAIQLALASCRLMLPVRPVEAAPAPMPIAQLRMPPLKDWSPPALTATPTQGGRYAIHNDTPPSTTHIAGANVAVTRARWELSELTPGEPNDGCWTARSATRWTREGWDCEVEARYALTSMPETFRISETLIARKDGAQIFRRASEREIARDLV